MNFVENLADKKKPWGYIKFTHKDGKVHEFYSCTRENPILARETMKRINISNEI